MDRHVGEYVISTDAARLDIDLIKPFPAQSYWPPGIPHGVLHREGGPPGRLSAQHRQGYSEMTEKPSR